MPDSRRVIGRWMPILGVVTMLVACEGLRADDPRPPADAPFGTNGEPQPRMSRRAQRRAARRRAPADQAPEDGVSATDPLPTVAPFASPAEVAPSLAHRDQPYGDSPLACQKFDIYLPAGCTENMPLVVWIHGKTWRAGTKDDCPVTWLTTAGYAVASVGYRLSSEATFPAQIDDCLDALATIERDAEIWGIDRERICVAGMAAGGHLAVLAGLWNDDGTPAPLPRVAAIGAFAAPTHLTSLGPLHDRAGSPASLLVGGPLPEFREAAQRASPLTYVASASPPTLLVHGRADTVVPPEQSIRFDAAMRAAGAPSQLVLLDGVGHDISIAQGTAAGTALLAFLDRTLGAAAPGR